MLYQNERLCSEILGLVLEVLYRRRELQPRRVRSSHANKVLLTASIISLVATIRLI